MPICLLGVFDKFLKAIILSDYPIFALNAHFVTLFITKYIEKELQHIFKTVLEAQVFISVFIPVLKSFKKRFFKVWFSEMYTRKNHIDYYNFCQQYIDHFIIIRAKKPKQNFFLQVLFLKNCLNFCWQ